MGLARAVNQPLSLYSSPVTAATFKSVDHSLDHELDSQECHCWELVSVTYSILQCSLSCRRRRLWTEYSKLNLTLKRVVALRVTGEDVRRCRCEGWRVPWYTVLPEDKLLALDEGRADFRKKHLYLCWWLLATKSKQLCLTVVGWLITSHLHLPLPTGTPVAYLITLASQWGQLGSSNRQRMWKSRGSELLQSAMTGRLAQDNEYFSPWAGGHCWDPSGKKSKS